MLLDAAEKSTHKVEVVPITLEKHPNADSLSIVRVFDGYTCCVRTEDWIGRSIAAYVPPDSVVDSSRPEFEFLKGHERVKVRKMRGVPSMGLLVPAPEGSAIGDNVAEQLGVTHYEPAVHLYTTGECEAPPDGFCPKYDVDSIRRYAGVFTPGEPVWVTEKIHGASARYRFHDGRMRCGSRTEWKRQNEQSVWWRALTFEMAEFCTHHPDYTLYGEVFGYVQDLRYGMTKGQVRFAAFDIWDGHKFLDAQHASELLSQYKVNQVPILHDFIPFDLDYVLSCAEGKTLIHGADHVREGCVVKPLTERWNDKIGRVILKAVGNGYLERA